MFLYLYACTVLRNFKNLFKEYFNVFVQFTFSAFFYVSTGLTGPEIHFQQFKDCFSPVKVILKVWGVKKNPTKHTTLKESLPSTAWIPGGVVLDFLSLIRNSLITTYLTINIHIFIFIQLLILITNHCTIISAMFAWDLLFIIKTWKKMKKLHTGLYYKNLKLHKGL